MNSIQKRKLGFYTDEQEADQYATEMLARIGIDPKHIVELHLVEGLRRQNKFGEADWLRYHQMDMNVCRKLYQNGWRDDQGNYVFVPIGELSVPHRGNCYRAYDSAREILAHSQEYHGLKLIAPELPQFLEKWDVVKGEAVALTTKARE